MPQARQKTERWYEDEFPARLRIHDARGDRVAPAMIRIEQLAVRSSPGERLEQYRDDIVATKFQGGASGILCDSGLS
jgi:hypothetical protein